MGFKQIGSETREVIIILQNEEKLQRFAFFLIEADISNLLSPSTALALLALFFEIHQSYLR